MGDQLLALIALFTVFGLPFLLDWIPYHSRMSVPDGCTPSCRAKIVDVSVDPVGNRKTRRLKTVVFFSDGTQYITFKSNDTPGFMSTHMVVDNEVLVEIFEDAIAAHDKLCGHTRDISTANIESCLESTVPILHANPDPAPEAVTFDRDIEITAEPPVPEELPDPQPEPDPAAAEAPTIADPTAPAPATPELRFCKHCGSPIDPTTRQCTGCGKQYFRPPVLNKKYLAIAAAALACVLVLVLIFNLTAQLNAANAQIEELSSQIAELEDAVAEKDRQITVYKRNEDAYSTKLTKKTEQYNELRDENVMLNDLLSFYEEYVAFVGDTGAKVYHELACPYMEMDDGFFIYSIPYVEDRGYKPCSHCCD